MITSILIIITLLVLWFNNNRLAPNKQINDNNTKETPKLIDDSIKKLKENYFDFVGALKEAYIYTPNYSNGIPQGVTIMNDYILITCYDYNNYNNSLVYVLNKDNHIINIVDLGMKSHVGGIVYDDIHNLIWIPDDNGTLNAYNSKDFLTKKIVTPIYSFNNISEGLKDYLNNNKNEIAYLCINNNILYIGSFGRYNNAIIKSFNIKEENDSITLEYLNTLKAPNLVQGMDFYTINNEKYLILSTSLGTNNNSNLEIYKFSEEITDINKMEKRSIILPPMAEQITINKNNLYIVFESNASKYIDSEIKVDKICVLDINAMIEYLK